MISLEELERSWLALPPRAPGSGVLRLIVLRTGGGHHAQAASVELVPGAGLAGDRFAMQEQRAPDAEISLIDARVAALLTADAPGERHLPGDNLQVDLDLCVAALPPGSRLRVGAALLELTEKPHLGCKKFEARLGVEALAWVNREETRARRLRGVYARVLSGGVVAVGDPVEARPAPVGGGHADQGSTTSSSG